MDVYALVDPTLAPGVSLISIHTTLHGAQLAGLEYAQKHAPIECPKAIQISAIVENIFRRLLVIDRYLYED